MADMIRPLRILFICYWGADDVLTQSTVWPRLQVLQDLACVEGVVLVMMERQMHPAVLPEARFPKVKYIAYRTGPEFTKKISDFINLPPELVKIAKQERCNIVLAHGAPAGALAYKVWTRTKLPFYVSSFEPHAAYMAESGVWKKSGLKYVFQKYWETKQQQYAAGLMPVSEHYRQYLIGNNVQAHKIRTVPSIVEPCTFRFDARDRSRLREELAWQHATVGIYAGKYGGLYYNEEAFHIYQKCFELIPDFRLLVLSPQAKEEILAHLRKFKIDTGKCFVVSVPQKEVPAYLSAADFAFATYKPGPSKMYLSPVKVGEYWANGLPVLLTEGVGDDSDIIRNEGGGALFNLQQPGSLEQAIQQIKAILQDPTHRQVIPQLAVRHRSPEKLREAYTYFFNQLQDNR